MPLTDENISVDDDNKDMEEYAATAAATRATTANKELEK